MSPTPLARLALSASPAPRVLVIDDDALVRRMLTHAFATRGCDPLMAEDGYSGFHTLVDQLLSLDLVLTDVMMPGFDGVELVHKIRHLGGEGDVAVVAMSAFLDDALRARLAAAGADAVIDKRVGPDEVAALAVEAYRARARRDE